MRPVRQGVRWHHRRVHWLVSLTGNKRDVERLAGESLPGLSTDSNAPRQLLLELHDPEGDATGDDAPRAAKAVIDASVRHINGFGRLRWGRAFEGVSVSGIKSFDADGRAAHQLFIEPAVDHMVPEEFGDVVEGLGYPRPPLPAGIEVVNALDGPGVTALAETNPDVARVLRLIELMLEGDDEIDWAVGYSALEVIEHDLARRQLDAVALGWWTKAERKRFTANCEQPRSTRRPRPPRQALRLDRGTDDDLRSELVRASRRCSLGDPAT